MKFHQVKYAELENFASKSRTQDDQYRGRVEKVASGRNIWFVYDLKNIKKAAKKSKSLPNDFMSTKLITAPSMRREFSVCSFMGSLFVFGGHYFYIRQRVGQYGEDRSYDHYDYRSTSYKYDCKTGKWCTIKHMSSHRSNSSCAVFEGKIVVSGGEKKNYLNLLKSVEAYDFHKNEWTDFPSMIYERKFHYTTSIGNKLFVVSKNISHLEKSSCEVFDSATRKFTIVKVYNNVQIYNGVCSYTPAVTIGRKIMLFSYADYKPSLIVYDVVSGQWTTAEVDFGSTEVDFVSKFPQI